MEKLQKENAVLFQQGSYRYKTEDASRIHITEQLSNLDCFHFDAHVPVEKRLLDFKANVINRGIKSHKDMTGEAFKNATRKNFERMKEA